jgi:hypothetical protein
MEEKLLLAYPSKSTNGGKYDINRLILTGDKGIYKGRSMIAQEQNKRKIPAFLFFAREQDSSLYLLQINPKKDCFSYLHKFDDFSWDNLPLNAKSYNWLYPSDPVKEISESFSSKKSTRDDLDNILSTVTSQDIEDVLSNERVDYIRNYKGTRWSLDDTIIRKIK